MLTVSRKLAVAVAALMLAMAAAPAFSLAQSAGDDQYSDPFGDSGSKQPSGGGSTDNGSEGSSNSKTPATPPPAAATPTAPTSPSVSELPRTGLDLRPLAAGGLLLIAAGLLLVRWSRTARL